MGTSSWIAYGPVVTIFGGAALAERLSGGPGGTRSSPAPSVAGGGGGGYRKLAAPLFLGTGLLVVLVGYETSPSPPPSRRGPGSPPAAPPSSAAGVAMERKDLSPHRDGQAPRRRGGREVRVMRARRHWPPWRRSRCHARGGLVLMGEPLEPNGHQRMFEPRRSVGARARHRPRCGGDGLAAAAVAGACRGGSADGTGEPPPHSCSPASSSPSRPIVHDATVGANIGGGAVVLSAPLVLPPPPHRRAVRWWRLPRRPPHPDLPTIPRGWTGAMPHWPGRAARWRGGQGAARAPGSVSLEPCVPRAPVFGTSGTQVRGEGWPIAACVLVGNRFDACGTQVRVVVRGQSECRGSRALGALT
jgi:hypothetical protein